MLGRIGKKMITRLKNKVRIDCRFAKGYGSNDEWYGHIFYRNRTIEKKTFHSCCSQAVWLDRVRRKYRKLSEEQLKALIKDAKQAFPICDQCLKPMVNGYVYQGNLQRCKTCSDTTPYLEVDEATKTRAKKREEAYLAMRYQ